jgi:hypothetical protein
MNRAIALLLLYSAVGICSAAQDVSGVYEVTSATDCHGNQLISLHLDDELCLSVQHTDQELLDDDIETPALNELVLYLNGRALPGTHPFVSDTKVEGNGIETTDLRFRLARDLSTAEGRAAWKELISGTGPEKRVTVSAGLADGPPLPSRITVDFSRFPRYAFGWSLALLALFAFGFFVVAFRTGALRDKEPAGEGTQDALQRAFSLSRFQAALWLVVVVYVYVVIFVSTGEFNGVVPESVLALLGISAGTFVSGAVIDRNRVRAKTVEQRKLDQEFAKRGTTNDEDLAREWKRLEDERTVSKTEGFWRDLLNNANGTGLHRLQLLVWTFVLLGVFVAYAWRAFAMADFDSTVLGLLGISAAAFAGTKTSETKKQE